MRSFIVGCELIVVPRVDERIRATEHECDILKAFLYPPHPVNILSWESSVGPRM
jgi:hypothetical protein